MPRTQLILLSSLLFFSAVVRLPSLMERGIDENEAISIMSVGGHAAADPPPQAMPTSELRNLLMGTPAGFGDIAAQLLVHDRYPPLYFWGASIWARLFGMSVESFRAISVLAFLALLASLALLTMPALPLALAGFFLLAVSLSGGALFYSTQARPYMTCLSITLCLGFFAARAERLKEQKGSALRYAALGLLAGCGFLSNYFMLYAACAVGAWIFLADCSREKLPSKATLVSAALYAGGFGLLAIYTFTFARVQFYSQPGLASGYSGPLTDLNQVFSSLAYFLVYWRANPVPYIVWALIILPGLSLFWRARNIQPRLWLLALLLFLAPLTGWLAMNGLLHKHLYRIRYLTFILPGFWLMLGVGLSALPKRYANGVCVALALLTFAEISRMNFTSEQNLPVYTSSPYRKIAKEIARTNLAEGTLLLLERGDERGWMAGLTYELGSRTRQEIRILPSEEAAVKYLGPSQRALYLADEANEPAKRAALKSAADKSPLFEIAREESWGLLTAPRAAPYGGRP